MQRTEKIFEQDVLPHRMRKARHPCRRAGRKDRRRAHRAGRHGVLPGGRRSARRPGHADSGPDGTVLRVRTSTSRRASSGIRWMSCLRCRVAALGAACCAGCIDWDWRFDKMQQHTGEHILPAILHQMFGREECGFPCKHRGGAQPDTSVPISPEGLRQAELAANRIVRQMCRCSSATPPGGTCRPCPPLQKGKR